MFCLERFGMIIDIILDFLIILKIKIKNFKLYWYVLFIFIWIIKESVLLFKEVVNMDDVWDFVFYLWNYL